MDINLLNKALVAIAEKRNELSKLSYDDSKYDDIEEELHDLEDSFNDAFGDQLEDIIADVHEEICPDSDVLLPTAYLAKKYKITSNGFAVEGTEGVWVEVDEFINKKTHLVLIPSPLRMELLLNGKTHKVVWEA